jgi:CheY-like chemotaxis protein
MNDIDIRPILLVEDDVDDQKLTLAALAQGSLSNPVVVAQDGEKALDYLYQRGEFKTRTGGNPILVLLDLSLPKVSGLEVLNIIKGDERFSKMPILVLTSSRETPDLIECYQHGINAFLLKPVEFSEFRTAVKDLGIFPAVLYKPQLAAQTAAISRS